MKSGNNGAVLICYLNLSGRNLGMTAGEMTFCSKYIAQFGRYMIIDGGVDCKSHVLTLIHQCGKHQVGKSEKRSTLTDITGIHVVRSDGHSCLGCTGFDFSEFYAYIFGELIAIVKEFF